MQQNPGLVGNGGLQNTSGLSTDGDYLIRQPRVPAHVISQKGQFQLYPDFTPLSMDPRSYQHSSQGSLSMEARKREQRMVDLWSHSAGVSQSQFLSVVRELKKTQIALKDAMKKLGMGDRQNDTSLESRVKAQQTEICELKQRIEHLQVHKKQLKNDIEGISVAPSSSSVEISRGSRESSFSKEEVEFSRREKQLQDEINNWKVKVENLKKENCEMKGNCARLERSLEEGKMSSIQNQSKLTKENAMLNKQLSDSEELQRDLLEQIQQLNNKVEVENRRMKKMEEICKQAIQDKNVLEQRIAEMKARQVEETNPNYSGSRKSSSQQSYGRSVSGGTQRTVEELQEALRGLDRQPSHNPRTYRCERCYEEFTSEHEHLHHVQKCID